MPLSRKTHSGSISSIQIIILAVFFAGQVVTAPASQFFIYHSFSNDVCGGSGSVFVAVVGLDANGCDCLSREASGSAPPICNKYTKNGSVVTSFICEELDCSGTCTPDDTYAPFGECTTSLRRVALSLAPSFTVPDDGARWTATLSYGTTDCTGGVISGGFVRLVTAGIDECPVDPPCTELFGSTIVVRSVRSYGPVTIFPPTGPCVVGSGGFTAANTTSGARRMSALSGFGIGACLLVLMTALNINPLYSMIFVVGVIAILFSP